MPLMSCLKTPCCGDTIVVGNAAAVMLKKQPVLMAQSHLKMPPVSHLKATGFGVMVGNVADVLLKTTRCPGTINAGNAAVSLKNNLFCGLFV